jgi:outer membrane protein
VKLSVLTISTLALSAAMSLHAQAPAAAAAPTKIGIIHIQNAILGTQDGQKALKELEVRAAPKRKDLETRQQEIVALQEQLNKSSNVGGEEAKQKLMRDIDEKKKKFSRDVDDAQADFDQENQKVLNEIGGKVIAVLDRYAAEHGYAVVLDVSNQQTSPVMFAANSVDVTREIVAIYDKTAASGGFSAPTPAPGAAAPRQTQPAPKPAAPKPLTPAPK